MTNDKIKQKLITLGDTFMALIDFLARLGFKSAAEAVSIRDNPVTKLLGAKFEDVVALYWNGGTQIPGRNNYVVHLADGSCVYQAIYTASLDGLRGMVKEVASSYSGTHRYINTVAIELLNDEIMRQAASIMGTMGYKVNLPEGVTQQSTGKENPITKLLGAEYKNVVAIQWSSGTNVAGRDSYTIQLADGSYSYKTLPTVLLDNLKGFERQADRNTLRYVNPFAIQLLNTHTANHAADLMTSFGYNVTRPNVSRPSVTGPSEPPIDITPKERLPGQLVRLPPPDAGNKKLGR